MISEKSKFIMSYFNQILPNATCELNYSKDFELVIAVMLSAQTTDKAVNKVTSVLFDKFPSLDDLNAAPLEDIVDCIRPLGLFQNKAKNIKSIVKDLIEKYNYQVPKNREDLMSLAGVGRKTANVIRCEIFNEPEFPIDTHIERISKRLGYAKKNDSVLSVEKKLCKSFPKEKYILLHHQFIHFGRYYCSSQKPKCTECPLIKWCNYQKVLHK